LQAEVKTMGPPLYLYRCPCGNSEYRNAVRWI
jgi:hypothetical protein